MNSLIIAFQWKPCKPKCGDFSDKLKDEMIPQFIRLWVQKINIFKISKPFNNQMDYLINAWSQFIKLKTGRCSLLIKSWCFRDTGFSQDKVTVDYNCPVQLNGQTKGVSRNHTEWIKHMNSTRIKSWGGQIQWLMWVKCKSIGLLRDIMWLQLLDVPPVRMMRWSIPSSRNWRAQNHSQGIYADLNYQIGAFACINR